MLTTHGYRKKNGCSTLNALVRLHNIDVMHISNPSARIVSDLGKIANDTADKAKKKVWGRSQRVADRLLSLRSKNS